MNVIVRIAALTLLATTLSLPALAQQKRQTPAKPQPKPAAAPSPAPTFDTFLPADSYVIYGEVRDAGQLIRSNTLGDLLEPVLRLARPSKEFRSVVKWINEHADQVSGSRLLIAAWPIRNNLPDGMVVIEFASADEATKFATPLNEFLPTVLPPMPADSNSKTAAPPKPSFHLDRLGSLVVISPRGWTMKELHPANSKLLSEDVNFRAARNRFSSEPIFAFVDTRLIKKEEEDRRKANEEAQRKEAELARQERAAREKQRAEETPDLDSSAEPKFIPEKQVTGTVLMGSPEQAQEAPTPDPVSIALSDLGSSLFGGESSMPEAVGLALSYEGDSFDLRALLMNAPGEKIDVIPFWPRVITGAAIAPETPNIFPATTDMFFTMSLDLPQVYAEISKPVVVNVARNRQYPPNEVELETSFQALEKRLKISFKDELLPLLGNEIAVGLPMEGLSIVGLAGPNGPAAPKKENAQEQPSAAKGPMLAIAVRDKERLQALMPKLVESMGFKGASAFAQTERHEDTEIVSYANLFAYAFIGNFLVLSSDPATTRYVVDSYLKHETLSSDVSFRSYTRWQPRQVYGEFYISPALMESYKTWATQPTTRLSDPLRSMMTRLSLVAQPVTYSLSNEGLGPLHEMHLPKNLVTLLVAGISGSMNPPPGTQSEREAMGLMYRIAFAERDCRNNKKAGNCGTMDDLIAAGYVSQETLNRSAYRFELTVNDDKFELSGVPAEYGKSGTMSYFMDHSFVLRGADHSGTPATASDPPVN